LQNILVLLSCERLSLSVFHFILHIVCNAISRSHKFGVSRPQLTNAKFGLHHSARQLFEEFETSCSKNSEVSLRVCKCANLGGSLHWASFSDFTGPEHFSPERVSAVSFSAFFSPTPTADAHSLLDAGHWHLLRFFAVVQCLCVTGLAAVRSTNNAMHCAGMSIM